MTVLSIFMIFLNFLMTTVFEEYMMVGSSVADPDDLTGSGSDLRVRIRNNKKGIILKRTVSFSSIICPPSRPHVLLLLVLLLLLLVLVNVSQKYLFNFLDLLLVI